MAVAWLCLPSRAIAYPAPKIDVFRPPIVGASLASPGDGFLYAGGVFELARFDGKSTQNLSLHSAFGAAWIHLLVGNAQGELFASPGYWDPSPDTKEAPVQQLGTRYGAGVWRMPKQQDQWQHITPELPPSVRVFSLLAAAGDALFVATAQGLLHLNTKTQAMRWIAEGLPKGEAVTALTNADGRLWVATTAAVWRQGPTQFERIAAVPHVRWMAAHIDGGVWAASTRALHIVRPSGEVREANLQQTEDRPELGAMLATRDKHLWLGTSNGVYVFDPQGARVATYGVAQGLPNEHVLSLLQDEAGAVWVGTRVGGIARVRTPLVENLGKPEALPALSVAVYATNDGALWFAGGARVCRRQNQTNDCHSLPLTDRKDQAVAIAAASDQSVFVATTAGALLHVSEQSVAKVNVNEPLPANVRMLLRLRDHSLLVGTSDGRVTHIAPVGKGDAAGDFRVQSVVNGSNGLCEGAVWSGHEAADGRVVLAMETGIGRLGAGGQVTCLRGHGLPTKGIRAVVMDDTRMWVGATNDQGLFVREKEGPFFNVNSDRGLYCDSLLTLVDDHHGGLWTTCGHGLQWMRKQSVIDAAHGAFPVVAAVGFSELDDLRSASGINEGTPSAALTADGGLLAATSSGAALVRAVTPLPKSAIARGPRVLSATLNGKLQPATAVLSAATVPSQLQILLQVPSLVSASRVHVVYRRDQSPWVNVMVPQAPLQIADLMEGEHTIVIRASDGVGGWLADQASLKVRVARPWQQRTGVLVALALSLVALTAAILGLRLTRTRKRFSLIAADRARVARELHDLLGQSFTAVALQVESARRLVTQDASAALHTLDEARATVSQAKTNLRHAIWNLREDVIERLPFTALLEQTFANLRAKAERKAKIVFSQWGDPLPRSAHVEYEVSQIASEAVWNALKHANANEIRVELTVAEGVVELVVCDDGRGFTADLAALASAGHFGLVGMRERATRIGAALSVTPAGPVGTQVRLTLPLARWNNT